MPQLKEAFNSDKPSAMPRPICSSEACIRSFEATSAWVCWLTDERILEVADSVNK